MDKLTPKASNKSAEPDILETLRLPCFAIFKPHAAARIAAVVEILMVLAPSPPVPTQSATSKVCFGNSVAHARTAIAAPAISSDVSPFTLSAVSTEANNAGSTLPLKVSVKNCSEAS